MKVIVFAEHGIMLNHALLANLSYDWVYYCYVHMTCSSWALHKG